MFSGQIIYEIKSTAELMLVVELRFLLWSYSGIYWLRNLLSMINDFLKSHESKFMN